MKFFRNKNAFTYIELLITLTFIGIIFLPTMQLFSHSLYSARASAELITAVNLAKWQMEKIKNMNLSEKDLAAWKNRQFPPADQPPLIINDCRWRIKIIIGENIPAELNVEVYKEGDNKPTTMLSTLIQDLIWEKTMLFVPVVK